MSASLSRFPMPLLYRRARQRSRLSRAQALPPSAHSPQSDHFAPAHWTRATGNPGAMGLIDSALPDNASEQMRSVAIGWFDCYGVIDLSHYPDWSSTPSL